MKKEKILLASNPAYWPSVGGSEMVLQKILEGSKHLFDRVVVFTFKSDKKIELHNGIEIRPYSSSAIRLFALKHRPSVYFPNMVHSPITFKNIAVISKLADKTICNLIGGYSADTKLAFRQKVLKKVEKHANLAIHVDPLSVEYFIDRAICPKVRYKFIPQGLNFEELDRIKKEKRQGKPYFVYAHNLWEWKAPDTFVEEIVGKMPDVDFKIIASDKTGNFIEKIRKMAPGYKNLELLLGLDRENFLKTLYCSSGVVSTSKIEGAQPNILLESGYLGVPYLSLAPGQNYGHYPHVEMLQGLEEMRSRLLEVVNDVYNIKKESLERAQKYFQSDKWHWDNVIKEYIKLFKE